MMKFDMGGSAAALGAAKAVGALQPEGVEVRASSLPPAHAVRCELELGVWECVRVLEGTWAWKEVDAARDDETEDADEER
eukprot:2037651-Rhodomonas_salina.1